MKEQKTLFLVAKDEGSYYDPISIHTFELVAKGICERRSNSYRVF